MTELSPCPTCGRRKPDFAIGEDGKCDACRLDAARAVAIVAGAPVRSVEEQWAAARVARDLKLAACDWTQVADAPLEPAAVAAWQAYRQQLRDVPETFETPASIVWPAQPA